MQVERDATTPSREITRKPKVIAQTADVRIVEYTLQRSESHPWHYHSQVSDRAYCLEGQVGVDIQTPPQKIVLRPGESYEVPPKTIHRVSNAGEDVCRYLLVQVLGKYDYIKTDEHGAAD